MADENKAEEGLIVSDEGDKTRTGTEEGTLARNNYKVPLEGELVADEAFQEYQYRNLAGTPSETIDDEIPERSLESRREPTLPPQEEFTGRNEHWEGVIHYQDTRHGPDEHDLPPGELSPRSSQWEGVQQTHTDTVDLEGEKLPSQVQRESSDRSQELALSHEHSLDH